MIRLLLFTAFWIWFGIKFHVPFWGGVFLYFVLLLYFRWLNEASKPCYVSEQDLKDFFGEAPAEEPSRVEQPSHVGQPVEKEAAPRTAATPAVDLTEPCRYTWKNYLVGAFTLSVFGYIICRLFF